MFRSTNQRHPDIFFFFFLSIQRPACGLFLLAVSSLFIAVVAFFFFMAILSLSSFRSPPSSPTSFFQLRISRLREPCRHRRVVAKVETSLRPHRSPWFGSSCSELVAPTTLRHPSERSMLTRYFSAQTTPPTTNGTVAATDGSVTFGALELDNDVDLSYLDGGSPIVVR